MSGTEAAVPARTCITCRHHKSVYLGLRMTLAGPQSVEVHGCGWGNLTDPVDGQRVYRRCATERDTNGGCGPGGQLWEPASA